MNLMQNSLYLTGRILLAIYFILPAISKIADVDGTAAYMTGHNVPFVMPLLMLTIFIQMGGGLCLLAGYRVQFVSFVLAGLVLVISYYMHDFWTMEAGLQMVHERQNFVKNMAIMAGLIVLAGSPPKLSLPWLSR